MIVRAPEPALRDDGQYLLMVVSHFDFERPDRAEPELLQYVAHSPTNFYSQVRRLSYSPVVTITSRRFQHRLTEAFREGEMFAAHGTGQETS